MACDVCTRALRLIAQSVLAAAMAALSACGGGGNAEGGPPAPGLAQSSPAQPQAAPAAASSGPGLVGEPPSVVNTTTAGQQVVRAVGALADGGYTVVWVTQAVPGSGTAAALSMRRYDAMGVPAGGEIPVAFDLALEADPAIAVLADGSLVVAYAANRPLPSPPGSVWESSAIYLQRFDPAGAPVGGETVVFDLVRNLVGAQQLDSVLDPAVIAWPDGSYLVGWSLQHDWGYTRFRDFGAQRFDAQGVPVGSVEGFPGRGDPNARFSIMAMEDGQYVLATTHSFMGNIYVTFGWRDSAGQPGGVGALYDADLGLPANQTLLVPLSGGGFVLWSRNAGGAWFQRLDGSGNAVGAQVPVAALPVAATALSDGGYVAFWQAPGSADITGQRYDGSDGAVGEPFPVGAAGTLPLAASLADVALALAWSAPGPQGDLDVFTQLLQEPGASGPGKARQAKRRACLAQAKDQKLTGAARRQFMAACLA